MTRSEWVLLQGIPGLLFLLSIAFRVDAASLSGVTATNETNETGVCAYLCDVELRVKPCEAVCVSRRQFEIQSNTVTDENKDVVDVGVVETRRDACPTKLCYFLTRILILNHCNCEATHEYSRSKVSLLNLFFEKVSDPLAEDIKNRIDDPANDVEEGDDYSERDNRPIGSTYSPIVSSRRIYTSPLTDDAGVAPTPRGAEVKTDYAIGEREDADSSESEDYPMDQKRTLEGISVNKYGDDFDLEEFCKIQCPKGNGGIVCGCDILP